MKIIVGVDGSEHANRAVEWCAKYARVLDAEVVAVHAIDRRIWSSPAGAAGAASQRWFSVARPTR